MAIIKTVNQKGKYHDENSRYCVINYICNPYKAKHGFINGSRVLPEDPVGSMEYVSKSFNKIHGVQLRHYILAFEPDEVCSPEIVFRIAKQISGYIGHEYQNIFAVHEDEPHLHIHFVVNTISFVDGHRWHGTKREFYTLKNAILNILRRYNINVLIYVPAATESDDY